MNHAQQTEKARAEQEYFDTIDSRWAAHQRTQGGPAHLPYRDCQTVDALHNAGIPLFAALRGIDTTFNNFKPTPFRPHISSLAYCLPEIYAAAAEFSAHGVRPGNDITSETDKLKFDLAQPTRRANERDA